MQSNAAVEMQNNIIHPTWLDYLVDLVSKLALANLKNDFCDQI